MQRVALLLWLTAGGALAQDDPASVVLDAYNNTLMQDSYRITVSQDIAQTITVGTGRNAQFIDQLVTQTIDGVAVRADDGMNVSMTMQQDMQTGMPNGDVSMTMDMIVYNGTVYLRFYDISPRSARSAFPSGWVNLSDASAIPGMDALNLDSLTSMYNSPIGVVLTADMLTDVVELDGDELDGQAMRVFEIALDVETLLESSYMQQFFDTFSSGQLGDAIDEMLDAMRDSAAMTITIWVGEDGLMHRADTMLTYSAPVSMMGTDMLIDATVQNTVVYSGFGDDYDILPPDAQ